MRLRRSDRLGVLVSAVLSTGALLLPLVVLPAAPVGAATTISWTRRASFTQPVQVVSARDGTSRLFVVEKAGVVRIYRNGTVFGTPFLDIRGRVDDAGEGGLLSIAFHPYWKSRPYFWVSYVDNGGDLQVVRFNVSRYTNNTVSVGTAQPVVKVFHPDAFDNHFAGQLAWGRTGYLFLSTGDGGGSGDPGNSAQDLTSLSGKILRMGVVGRHAACGRPYCVPSSNPYARSSTRKKLIWASGVRNGWRFSIDPRTGDLWIGDVGQGRREEIDKIAMGRGGRNLGWSCKEGRLIFNSSRCRSGVTYHNPLYTYGRDFGTTITGGFIYRGSRYRSLLAGRYVGADFGSGRTFVTTSSGLRTVGSLDGITSFGEGGTRELWAVTIGGGLYRMSARA